MLATRWKVISGRDAVEKIVLAQSLITRLTKWATDDRTINPNLERFMAKRMGAKTIEVKASHLALISQPDTIAALILEAAGQK